MPATVPSETRSTAPFARRNDETVHFSETGNALLMDPSWKFRAEGDGFMRVLGLVALLVGLTGFAPTTADAQQPQGTVRTQGRLVEQPGADAGATPVAPRAAVNDPREDMRAFVQAIKTFTRGHNRNFMVVPMNGLELIEKVDPVDTTVRAPANTYMRSIDGVLQEALFYGDRTVGTATEKKRQEPLLALTEIAKKNRLKVLTLDYANTNESVSSAIRMSLAKGYVPFVAPAKGLELNRIPFGRPVNENPNSIVSFNDVRNFLMLRDSSRLGRQDEFAMKVHDTNYDLIVTDVFHSLAEPLSRQAVETLKYKKLGAKRLVFAYVNIGFAASYRFYWKPEWKEGSPGWIGSAVPGDPDRYFVQFWNPEWQNLMIGGTKSYIYGCVAQGFDGVVLDGVDVYRFFEGGLEAYMGLD